MAHFTFAAYGIKRDMDELIKWLETRIFSMEVTDKEGNKTTVGIQGQLRPILLFDYIFPEENLDLVLNTFTAERLSHEQYKKVKALRAITSKALGLKKIPPYKKDKAFPLPVEAFKNISIYPLGVRYDDKRFFEKDGKDGEGLYHEAL